MIYLSVLVSLFYIVVLVVYLLVVKRKLLQKLFHKLVHRNTTEEQQAYSYIDQNSQAWLPFTFTRKRHI